MEGSVQELLQEILLCFKYVLRLDRG